MPVRVAHPSEILALFAALFAHLPPDERLDRARVAERLFAAGQIDPSGVFTTDAADAVLLCQTVPGAGGLIWPPSDCLPADASDLIRAGVAHLFARGAKLAQCLLPRGELRRGLPLLREGFSHVTDLHYLRSDLLPPAPWLSPAATVRLRTLAESDEAAFAACLDATFADTLDCPELNGLRDIADVLAGHRAQGKFDPSRWILAVRGEDAVGVLVLTDPEPDELEVSYLGVVPSARRTGVARELLAHALIESRAAGVSRLVLSVDARNAPARRLYDAAGFEEYDVRHVLLLTRGEFT